MERVLVLGGTGYAGRFLVQELVSRGYAVTAVVRDIEKALGEGTAGAPPLSGDDVALIQDDITNPTVTQGLCQNIDRVVSALGVTRQKADPWNVDFRANLNVLKDAVAHKTKSFLFLGSLNLIAGNSEQKKAKRAFAGCLEVAPIATQMINPSGFFSDMSGFFHRVHAPAFLLPPAEAKLNPIHGADLATFAVDRLGDQSGVWDIGGPDIFTYRELVEMIAAVKAEPVKVVIPPQKVWDMAVSVGGAIGGTPGTIVKMRNEFMTRDAVGDPTGTHHLKDFFIKLAEAAPKTKQS